MGKQSSQECCTENKSAGFDTVEKPKVVAMQLQLLPSDILRDILSRLSLKEVTRMSILSRDWRRLRICHPDLVFTKETFFANNTAWITNVTSKGIKFVANVDNLLHPLWTTSTTTTVTLDTFAVKFKLHKGHKDHIDRWITFSIASRAKHIAIDFTEFAIFGSICDQDKYVIPLCNLGGPNGSCVKHLDLGNVCLKLPPSFLGITNLKKLTLNMVSISRGDLQCLLLSCSLLESLSIESCSLASLIIPHELCRLQNLLVRFSDLEMLELHAPNLTKFEFDDHLRKIMLTGSFKLSEATFVSDLRSLPYDVYAYNFSFTEITTAIPHVHKLFLLLNIDQVLAFSETQTKFLNLRHLNMNLEIHSNPFHTRWVLGFVNLLKSAPLLEDLELHLGRDIHYFLDPSSVTAAQGPVHHHLKNVYMSGFCDVFGLAELALYILANATALKRMVVDPAAYCDPWNDDIYSVSKGCISKECQDHINQKRMFAEKHLDREEFGHILTIL